MKMNQNKTVIKCVLTRRFETNRPYLKKNSYNKSCNDNVVTIRPIVLNSNENKPREQNNSNCPQTWIQRIISPEKYAKE